MERKSFLETLAVRPIIGDGSYTLTLEKRGYVHAGRFTCESVVEFPDAVKGLHTEFMRAGADVIQAYSFYSSDGKLKVAHKGASVYTSEELNKAAIDEAHCIADPAGLFMCGGISPTPTYDHGHGDPVAVKAEFTKQVKVFKTKNTSFLLGEFFAHTGEAEIAAQAMKEAGLPVAVTMRMGPHGDHDDVTPGECAVRLVKAGADLVGINCSFDPATCIKTVTMMKEGLEAAGLHAYLMLQPVGYHCPDVVDLKDGYHDLPEFPLALEPRQLTRFDARQYARDAYEAGVRYIGGCCGFEPHHIREMAEELSEELGRRPPGKDKHEAWGKTLYASTWPGLQKRVGEEYWGKVVPGTGRPLSPSVRNMKDRTFIEALEI